MPGRNLPGLFQLFPGIVRIEACIERSDNLQTPSGSAVTASPKAAADGILSRRRHWPRRSLLARLRHSPRRVWHRRPSRRWISRRSGSPGPSCSAAGPRCLCRYPRRPGPSGFARSWSGRSAVLEPGARMAAGTWRHQVCPIFRTAASRLLSESGLPALPATASGLPDRLAWESGLPVLPVTRSALPAVPDAPPVPPALAPRSIQFPSYPRKFRLLSTAARFACWPNRSRVAWSR